MATDPRLAAELRVMTKAERRVLRQLSIAYAQMTRQIRAWESSSRVGAQVSAAQARVLQTSLRAQMAAMWRAVGNEVRAGRLEAAQLAQQPSKGVLDYFRAAGLTPSEVAQLAESTLAAAEQTVDTALRRMLGESYIPLSDQVWRTQALVDGRLDTVINTTLMKGVNARQLAQAVRGFVRPDARGGTRYAANRLARTEINNAFHAANVSEMQAEPFTTFIQWHLSGSHPKPDECNQYAEKNHVKGQEAGVYEKANVPRRPHPNCLCYTTGLTVERDEFIAAFQRGEYDDWLRGKGVDPGPAHTVSLSPRQSVAEYAWGKGDKQPLVFSEVNEGLRAGKKLSGKAAAVRDGLDKEFESVAPLGYQKKVYRQVPGSDNELMQDILSSARNGNVWSDKAYLSTTTDLDILPDFDMDGTGVRINIVLPKGQKAINVDKYTDTGIPGAFAQNEWLLPRGSRMVLSNPRRLDDGWVVDAQVLLPGQTKESIAPKQPSKAEQVAKLERSIATEQARGRKGNAVVKAAAAKNVQRMRMELNKLKRR